MAIKEFRPIEHQLEMIVHEAIKAIRLMRQIEPCLYIPTDYPEGKRVVPRIRTIDWNNFLSRGLEIDKKHRLTRPKTTGWEKEELRKERERALKLLKE